MIVHCRRSSFPTATPSVASTVPATLIHQSTYCGLDRLRATERWGYLAGAAADINIPSLFTTISL